MNTLYTISIKELKSYFFSPLAYVIMTVFTLLAGYFFTGIIFQTRNANEFSSFINTVSGLLILVIPIITMRSFAEENRAGTFELLLSYPLASWHVVIGKFIGATLFTLIMILPTFIYVTFLEMYSVPDYGIITGGYIGLILLSMCYISFGLFASSLTKSQVVAAISCFGMLLMLWAVDMLVEQFGYNIGAILRTISLRFHFYFFSIGVIDSRGIVFILSVIIFMLLLTVKIIEDKRFRS